MKTKVTTSFDQFIGQQREYQGWIRLLKRVGGTPSVIARMERDMANNACAFFIHHAFPNVLLRDDGNKSKARRARQQAGSERAK